MDSHNALQGCVSSLRMSMQLMDSSIEALHSGVSDYPRLTKVLRTTKHFELVSESELVNAQSALLSEIKPEINNLLTRVEVYLDKLERREQSLIAKADLQSGRLSQPTRLNSKTRKSGPEQAQVDSTAKLTAMEEAKLQQVKQKKDRLSYAVSRLELQAGQRERQLRKSMAAQPSGDTEEF